MHVVVEFFGVSRRLTGTRECHLELEQRAKVQDVIRELARRFPRLVEGLIDGGLALAESFRLNVDGRPAGGLDTELKGDERLLLVSATWEDRHARVHWQDSARRLESAHEPCGGG
jgi:molybdopterin converting factor small subunit